MTQPSSLDQPRSAKTVPLWLAVALGSTAVLCALGWRLSLRPAASDWGNVAEWVAAIGTVGTLAAAVLAIRGEFGSMQEERGRLRRLQGSQVSGGIIDSASDEDGLFYNLVIANASDLPIYSVTATVGPPAGHDGGAIEYKYLHLPPHTEQRERVSADLSPTGALIFYELTFKDSNGLGWLRSAEGDLIETEPPDYLGCS